MAKESFEMDIDPLAVYNKSDQVTAREIEGEFIIATINPAQDELFGELYFLNETGRELWEHLDGKLNLSQLIHVISKNYDMKAHSQIQNDVIALIKDLLAHQIIIKVK